MHVSCMDGPRPVASFAICNLVCGDGVVNPCHWVIPSIPFLSGLGVRTWVPPLPPSPGSLRCQQTPSVILGTPALSLWGRGLAGKQGPLQHVPRPTCLLHVSLPHPQPRWSLPV